MNTRYKSFIIALIIEIIIISTLWIIKSETNPENNDSFKLYILALLFQTTPIISYLLIKINTKYKVNQKNNYYNFLITKNIITDWEFIILNIICFIGLYYFVPIFKIPIVLLSFTIFYINNCILTLLFNILRFLRKDSKFKNESILLIGFSIFILANIIIPLSEETSYIVTSFFPLISINLIAYDFNFLSLILFTIYLMIILIWHFKLSKRKNSLI